MRTLGAMATILVLLSCRGKGPASEGEDLYPAQAKRALAQLEAVLVEQRGLVIEQITVGEDSIHAVVRLTDEAIAAWNQAERVLGRPPSLAWVAVSAQVSHAGQVLARQSLRLGHVRGLSAQQPVLRLAIAKRPARGTQDQQLVVPAGSTIECTVLSVRAE